MSTRIEEHKKSIEDENWDSSWISKHAQFCKLGYQWDKTDVLKLERKIFDRKVREALEIQYQNTSPRSEHGLNQDDGQYVMTKFWNPMLTHLQEKSIH